MLHFNSNDNICNSQVSHFMVFICEILIKINWFLRLEEEKARTRSKVQAETQTQVQDEISKILSAERTLGQESLQQAIIRERLATEDEKRRAELFVSLFINSVEVVAAVTNLHRLTWSLSKGNTVSKTGMKLKALTYWFLHF